MNQELSKFRKFNKKAREVRAKRLGFQSAAAYIAFLLGGGSVVPVVGIPKKAKNVKAILSPEIPTIHIVDIADKSGSMAGGKDRATVTGINKGLNELRTNVDGVNYTYTYCRFDSVVYVEQVAVHPDKAQDIRERTGGMTALWDAIGMTVVALKPHVKEGDKVLINIYTDGEENSSKKYNSRDIKEMITDLSAKGWTFTFIGTEYDVNTIVAKINIHISNTRSYDGTAAGLQASMHTNSVSRSKYVQKVKNKEDVSVGYFHKDLI